MPTLLERTRTVRERISELGRIDAERDNLEKLTTRAEQVRKRADDLQATMSGVRRLQANGVSLGKLPKVSQELRAKPAALRTALRSDWTEIAGDSVFAATFLVPTGTHVDKVREVALTGWRIHVDAIVPKINDGLLDTLARTGFATQVARLRDLRAQVSNLRERVPIADDAFDCLASVASEIRTSWSQLEGVPIAVVEFLTKAAQRQATFADLTPEVHEWLKKQGMIPQLRIGLG